MASTRLLSIEGRKPPLPIDSDEVRLESIIKEKIASLKRFPHGSYIPQLELFEDFIKGFATYPKKSSNPVHFLTATNLGNQRIQRTSFDEEYATRHLINNSLWREREYDLGTRNKIFCSQWLNHRQVVMGSKCNNILVLDVNTGKTFKIPNLPSSGNCKPRTPVQPCGIHAIEINPSRSLLATGGDQPHELAIYKLPSFEPVAVGESGHEDIIFDISWLDDEFLVSGSRDSSIALWKVSNDDECNTCPTKLPVYMKPITIIKYKEMDTVRCLIFNRKEKQLVALSKDSKVHLFDVNTLTRSQTVTLPPQADNVCLTYYGTGNQYAVGSKNHITMIDERDLRVKKILFREHQMGVRSIDFSNDIMSIGTGHQMIMFYDMRAQNFLKDKEDYEITLATSRGYVLENEELYATFPGNIGYHPAVYTHKFDSSNLRLFAAGGPLGNGSHGCYAGLWY